MEVTYIMNLIQNDDQTKIVYYACDGASYHSVTDFKDLPDLSGQTIILEGDTMTCDSIYINRTKRVDMFMIINHDVRSDLDTSPIIFIGRGNTIRWSVQTKVNTVLSKIKCLSEQLDDDSITYLENRDTINDLTSFGQRCGWSLTVMKRYRSILTKGDYRITIDLVGTDKYDEFMTNVIDEIKTLDDVVKTQKERIDILAPIAVSNGKSKRYRVLTDLIAECQRIFHSKTSRLEFLNKVFETDLSMYLPTHHKEIYLDGNSIVMTNDVDHEIRIEI